MGQEIDAMLLATRDALNADFGVSPTGRWKDVAAVRDYLPRFELLRDRDYCFQELDVGRPYGLLTSDDVRRGLRLGYDRMTGLTTLDVPCRLIIVTPRNRAVFDEDIARDWAATVFAGFRRRMIYDGDGNPLLSERTEQVVCQRIRGPDAFEMLGRQAPARDDASAILWELVWLAPVPVDPRTPPKGEAPDDTYRLERLYVTDVGPDELDTPAGWPQPQQVIPEVNS